VRKEAAANGGRFELVALDLADLKSVRACADRLMAKGEAFDLVIANAGVMATPFGHTVDGFETQFGTNHLGHFVLVNRIASLIRTGGRLVNLSSSGHRFSNVVFGDPNFERTPYDPMVAYGRSKTANILFAVAFVLPYLPFQALFGFVPLPAPLMLAMIGLTALYVVVTEVAKRVFYAQARNATA
jgi:NAD(P)-dependent dehydrogenase (short-subunit alcohol dehydrogenase family)